MMMCQRQPGEEMWIWPERINVVIEKTDPFRSRVNDNRVIVFSGQGRFPTPLNFFHVCCVQFFSHVPAFDA
jgi:hypothetical protein